MGPPYGPPAPPCNLTLDSVLPREATISWDVRESDDVTSLEMTHWPMGGVVQAKVVTGLNKFTRRLVLAKLSPLTQYEVFLVALNIYGMSNRSATVTFRTLNSTMTPDLHVSVGEIGLIALALIAWVIAIGLFLHKWGRIRILQPREPRFKHAPKNIESVKVVEKPAEGVIYSNYPKEMSRAMSARQKRINRMHTMPELRTAGAEETPTLEKTATEPTLQIDKSDCEEV